MSSSHRFVVVPGTVATACAIITALASRFAMIDICMSASCLPVHSERESERERG